MSDYSHDGGHRGGSYSNGASTSSYTATISTDQVVISRREYNSFLETRNRFERVSHENHLLKREVSMLQTNVKNIMASCQNMMDHYMTAGKADSDYSQFQQEAAATDRVRQSKFKAKSNRRDSGVDGVHGAEMNEDAEDLGSPHWESQEAAFNGRLGQNGRQRGNSAHGHFSGQPKGSLNARRFNEELLVHLDEEADTSGAGTKSSSISGAVPRSSGSERGAMPAPPPPAQTNPRVLKRNHTPAPQVPPEPIPVQTHAIPTGPKADLKKKGKKIVPQPEPESESEKEQEDEREGESWEYSEPQPTVTFDLDDSWKADDWGTPSANSAPQQQQHGPTWPSQPAWRRASEDTTDSAWTEVKSSKPGKTTATYTEAAAAGLPRPKKYVPPHVSSEETTPLPPASTKTARDLFLERQAEAARQAEAKASSLPQELSEPADSSTFRHIYIPDLPSDANIGTVTKFIRTNGNGLIESISMFRQKPLNGETNTMYEVAGNGEPIGANITFHTAAGCQEWFMHLVRNSSPKLQKNPEKTFLFPTEDCAASWKKCAVLRRADYHPSIAGKIDKGGPGGVDDIENAVKSKGLRRVLVVSGLPSEITETELARLSMPPGSRSLTYEGPSHKASGQSILTTEEFARWKWIEKIVIEDDRVAGFGEGGPRKKVARIYLAGIKTAFLARKKIWNRFNRDDGASKKRKDPYVQVMFGQDECEGPLSEVPSWIGVIGDDADSGEEAYNDQVDSW
ncbi:hypothetical protein DFH27DRAFT_250958 [Peziza echinospora]|nr:hypothetical protein DFH27DRAFT_250958 [Peziza echinospora]